MMLASRWKRQHLDALLSRDVTRVKWAVYTAGAAPFPVPILDKNLIIFINYVLYDCSSSCTLLAVANRQRLLDVKQIVVASTISLATHPGGTSPTVFKIQTLALNLFECINFWYILKKNIMIIT